ncbi:conserved hypothetical protein [Dichelobacter nodosus VCS1703A]|uniref:Uncharacterized protein n=2 Tax=Dichelobacter nodosus TaxID=870 RepID=A5EWE7_DICNV|nr:hypothetical protein [Dichelobacter nodosus]ABQ13218.1 conserved hypothetical protein [Dichelobacter nodosus VCS1703A]
MSVAKMFSNFIDNLAVSNREMISMRYGELTSALNKQFRNTESKTANTLQIGSFGRKTGINGISDLDMLYIMPKNKWDIPLESIRARRDALLDELHAVYAKAPSTNFKAYSNAQKSLKKLEDMTFSDEEIDAFLPKELKKVSKGSSNV